MKKSVTAYYGGVKEGLSGAKQRMAREKPQAAFLAVLHGVFFLMAPRVASYTCGNLFQKGIRMNATSHRGRRFALFAILMSAASGWLGAQAATYGLHIGINRYDPNYGAGNLEACINDVTDIRNSLLVDSSRWQAGTLSLVTDSLATKANVRALLQQLAATAVSGDVVLYNQSSHGGQYSGTSTFLCMHDADFADTEIAADLSLFRDGVTIIMIIDACHSGGLFKDASGSPTWPLAESVMRHYDEIQRAKGKPRAPSIGWMTACDYNQLSYEISKNAIFSGHLIQGFTNAGTNADGNVTFGALFDYAYPRTIADEPTQVPQLLNRALLDATVARGTAAPAAHTNTLSAYVNAYYGKLNTTYAYCYYVNSDTYGYLAAAYSFADYACLYAYYAYLYDATYGTDCGFASYACQYAYYANLYASYAYAYETGDAYSYYGALYEYNAYFYSYLVATGQR